MFTNIIIIWPELNASLISFFFIADLSFNNIEVIEGLDKLTKLKDLTLSNNRISKIENMDSLSQLHVFSIGNNSLKQLDNVSTHTVHVWVRVRVFYNLRFAAFKSGVKIGFARQSNEIHVTEFCCLFFQKVSIMPGPSTPPKGVLV